MVMVALSPATAVTTESCRCFDQRHSAAPSIDLVTEPASIMEVAGDYGPQPGGRNSIILLVSANAMATYQGTGGVRSVPW